MIHILLIICSLFSFSLTHADAINLCVADLKGIRTPSGYSCKHVNKVSVDDFVYTGLRHPRKISNNTRKASVTRASVAELPALNGQGVSMSRVDLPRGGSVPMHTHPGFEILMVRQGSVKAGFRTSANKVFEKTLEKDDIMVIPQGMEHFVEDIGVDIDADVGVNVGVDLPNIDQVMMADLEVYVSKEYRIDD